MSSQESVTPWGKQTDSSKPRRRRVKMRRARAPRFSHKFVEYMRKSIDEGKYTITSFARAYGFSYFRIYSAHRGYKYPTAGGPIREDLVLFPVSEEKKEKIWQLWLKGATVEQLSNAAKLSIKTIRKILKRRKLPKGMEVKRGVVQKKPTPKKKKKPKKRRVFKRAPSRTGKLAHKTSRGHYVFSK